MPSEISEAVAINISSEITALSGIIISIARNVTFNLIISRSHMAILASTCDGARLVDLAEQVLILCFPT